MNVYVIGVHGGFIHSGIIVLGEEVPREWRRPTKRSDVSNGTRVRFLGIRSGPMDSDDTRRLNEFILDKRPAGDFVESIPDLTEWKYGRIVKGRIETDSGGVVDIPSLKMVEAYLKPKATCKRTFDFSKMSMTVKKEDNA